MFKWQKAIVYFKKNETFKYGILVFIDQILSSATNFMTGVILARSCAIEEFGMYVLGFTIASFVIDLQLCLISTPYMIHSTRFKGQRKRQYTGSTLIHQLLLCALIVIFLMLAGTIFPSVTFLSSSKSIMSALTIVISFMMLKEYARRVSFAQLQINHVLILDLNIALIQIGGLSLLSFFGSLTAVNTYVVIGIACGLTIITWLLINRDKFDLNIHDAIVDFKHNWLSGKWLLASGILWSISMNFYPWILALFHGTGAAAIWSACLGIINIVNPFILGLQNLVGPKMSRSFAEGGVIELTKFVSKANIISLIITAPFSILLLVFGNFFVTKFYGSNYAGNNLLITIMALNILISAVAFSYSRALFVLNNAFLDFYINFISFVILITAGIWLVKFYGPLGVAISLVMSNFIATVGRYVFYIRSVKTLRALQ